MGTDPRQIHQSVGSRMNHIRAAVQWCSIPPRYSGQHTATLGQPTGLIQHSSRFQHSLYRFVALGIPP